MKVNLDKWHNCEVNKRKFIKILEKKNKSGFKGVFILFGYLASIIYIKLTQHTGLNENIQDHRYTTKAIILNHIFIFLYWHMGYYSDYHMLPSVPSSNLPKLNKLLKEQMPPSKKGLWGAYKEIIPTVLKQAKDPNYKLNVLMTNL